MRGLLSEFRDFLARGSLIELAVAVVIGVAFGAVITSLVEDLITPIIGAIAGEPNFSGLTFTVNGSVFRYGEFLNALLTFLIVALVVFLLVVKTVNLLVDRLGIEPSAAGKRPCPECLGAIPRQARRCSHCASPVQPLS